MRSSRRLAPTAAVLLLVTAWVIALGSPPRSLGKTLGWAGDSIVFESHRDGDAEIYMMDRNGEGERNLTQSPGRDGQPSWEPPVESCNDIPPDIAPQRLAFESDADGNPDDGSDLDVFLSDPVDDDTTGPVGRTNLTPNSAADDTSPVWSTGLHNFFGHRFPPLIAFTTNRDGNREIYVMRRDGSGQTNMTNNASDDANPEWSPDGNYIAFESDRDGTRQIWIVRVVRETPPGEDERYVPTGLAQATHGGGPKYDPSWSEAFLTYEEPIVDSMAHLLLYSTEVNGARYIDLAHDVFPQDAEESHFAFSSGATETWELTGDPGDDGGPSWAPGGFGLVFDSSRGGNKDIYVMVTKWNDSYDERTWGDPTQLTDDPAADLNPDWRPGPDCDEVAPRPPRPAPVTRRGHHSSGGDVYRSGTGGGGNDGGGNGGRSGGSGGGKPRCTIRGSSRNDVLRGTRHRDRICAGGGNDRIYGRGGNDRIDGGRGNDSINGGSGNDRLFGGPGGDRIYGGRGHDRIYGGSGKDRIVAKDGERDFVSGGPGRDKGTIDRGLDRVGR